MTREEFLLVDGRELVVTPAMHVRCDGRPETAIALPTSNIGTGAAIVGGGLGHPIEYMTLEKGAAVQCKYCGRRYVHASSKELDAIRAKARPYPG
jgi:hypothetical protein